MPEQTPEGTPKKQGSYTMKDAMQVADDILNLSKEKKYTIGAFVHGQIFALEFSTIAFGVPAQQIAEIKRDCRKYITEMLQYQRQEVPQPQAEEQPEPKAAEKTEGKAKPKTQKKTEQNIEEKTE